MLVLAATTLIAGCVNDASRFNGRYRAQQGAGLTVMMDLKSEMTCAITVINHDNGEVNVTAGTWEVTGEDTVRLLLNGGDKLNFRKQDFSNIACEGCGGRYDGLILEKYE